MGPTAFSPRRPSSSKLPASPTCRPMRKPLRLQPPPSIHPSIHGSIDPPIHSSIHSLVHPASSQTNPTWIFFVPLRFTTRSAAQTHVIYCDLRVLSRSDSRPSAL